MTSALPDTATIGNAPTLEPEEPVSGTLATAADQEWYAITLQAGLSYALMETANTSSFHVTLVDASGADASHTVDQFGLWGPNYDPYQPPDGGGDFVSMPPPVDFAHSAATYTFQAISDETVYAQVDGAYAGPLADGQSPPAVDYTVELGAQDDDGATPSTSRPLAVGGTVTGNFDVPNDVDAYSVALDAGTTYQFQPTSGPLLELQLYGADPTNYLAYGLPYYPPLTYTPDQTGIYYLDASTQEPNGLGQYTISAAILDTSSGQAPGLSEPATVPSDTTPVYRFFDSTDGAQFLTADATEVAALATTRPDLTGEGVAFQTAASSDPNAAPVFRFFDVADGTHFFTASASERETVLATRPDLKLEGVAFYEYQTQQPNSIPVYRAFDTTNGTHFLTSSASEVANLAATRPDLTSEGIAFFAPST